MILMSGIVGFFHLDYSRVKNAVRSGDDAACEGVLRYVEQAARKPMR